MEFIKNVETSNFAISIIRKIDADNIVVSLKALTDTGKALLRHKKLVRGSEMAIAAAALLTLVAELEQKASVLASL